MSIMEYNIMASALYVMLKSLLSNTLFIAKVSCSNWYSPTSRGTNRKPVGYVSPIHTTTGFSYTKIQNQTTVTFFVIVSLSYGDVHSQRFGFYHR